jgi:hypothetical protein
LATGTPADAPHDQAEVLAAVGVVGLRMSDLQDEENVACCGDCRFLALLQGGNKAVCELGYATTVYNTWAARCLHFTLREPLPDTPQEDERAGRDRRTANVPVRVERRTGRDRRATT